MLLLLCFFFLDQTSIFLEIGDIWRKLKLCIKISLKFEFWKFFTVSQCTFGFLHTFFYGSYIQIAWWNQSEIWICMARTSLVGGEGASAPLEFFEIMHGEIRIKLDVHGEIQFWSMLTNLRVLFQKLYDRVWKIYFQNLYALFQHFVKFDDYLKLELVWDFVLKLFELSWNCFQLPCN